MRGTNDNSRPPANPVRDNFEDVLDLLVGVQRVTADEAVAICPAHPRARASLAVRRGLNGVLSLRCYGGCTQDEVLRALGRDRSILAPMPEQAPESIDKEQKS